MLDTRYRGIMGMGIGARRMAMAYDELLFWIILVDWALLFEWRWISYGERHERLCNPLEGVSL